ncbi:HORMA domain-containing protein 1 isoform X1 [Epinephelus lanceolatus]|uniref:HORMA domain-containing protein 1 isoform X1 n=1 Tax=Epinephelus lanceolatus TaxID=310571 RepID=UPI00144574A4|nr:HORMA domain-containing protein 1 isoform X1 [Epinephelus lanceolatus]XP_033497272.1 HORMA domain-containing protein 1 isoform X1 [Epinephelus lanceolatus]XP_033497273.1 HORMA domain-containing protein 1 isoform X1 [Epinephelus lanceolatus]
MACVQQVRTSQDTQLLPNQVLSEQQSLVVIKKLLAIAVSGITYLRGLFPEKAFGSKYVEDQKVMILKEERSCPGANQIVQWMQGCFEAIEKKYLRAVIMSLYTDPENPQKVTEFYQFKIKYTPKGAKMDFESTNNNNNMSTMSCGNTKKASILLVRKLYTLMQNLGPLPDNVCLNMKLAYYDNVTPQDYQPSGFKEADGDILEFEREPVKLTMGEVLTPFHSLKLDMGTERHRLEQVEESSHVTEKWLVNIEEENVMSETHVTDDVSRPDENSDLDNTEIQMICDEKIESCEEATEMDTLVEKTSDIEVGLKRTRSGRVLRSSTKTDLTDNKPTAMKDKAVSQYDIPNSQETPTTSAPKKRPKFSEPKERF